MAILIFGGLATIVVLDFYFLDFQSVEFDDIDIKIPEFERPETEPIDSMDEREEEKAQDQDVDEADEEETTIEDEDQEEDALTRQGIIEHTNQRRVSYELSPLTENEKLNQAAEEKVRDMFENQYFAHESLEGKGAEHLVTEMGYEYILVGENLAKGRFEDDEALVEGWMNSPDHRESILTEGYEEIGTGIGRDYYEGNEIWMAVQIFGTPVTACPQIDGRLSIRIEEKQLHLEDLKEEIDYYEELIAEMDRRDDDYDRKVEEYYELIEEHNSIVGELRTLIEEYNNLVEAKNKCLEGYEYR